MRPNLFFAIDVRLLGPIFEFAVEKSEMYGLTESYVDPAKVSDRELVGGKVLSIGLECSALVGSFGDFLNDEP